MPVIFPPVRVGQPMCHQSLSVFPLYVPEGNPVDYCLADEAIHAEHVAVEEVGEQGTVPELIVENKGDVRVLFLEGEQLIGAKQNRVLNTSVLIPAKSKVRIPVSCVEHGRWHYSSPKFSSSDTMCHSPLRYALKSSVTMSLKSRSGHRSDQGAVWEEVERQQKSLGVSSETIAMSDTFGAHAQQVEDYRENLPYPEGAAGLAVAIGARVVAVDIFDKPATCARVWNRLLSGYVLDALEATQADHQAEPKDVETMLDASTHACWDEAPAIGEGEEFRAEFASNHASTLSLHGAPVHFSVLAARA